MNAGLTGRDGVLLWRRYNVKEMIGNIEKWKQLWRVNTFLKGERRWLKGKGKKDNANSWPCFADVHPLTPRHPDNVNPSKPGAPTARHPDNQQTDSRATQYHANPTAQQPDINTSKRWKYRLYENPKNRRVKMTELRDSDKPTKRTNREIDCERAW